MSTPLKIYLGEESHYITEDYDSRETSIFADQYKKALKEIDAYIEAKDDGSETSLQESRNNIIAFMGDRGTGKTSCMMSVLNMLDAHLKEGKKNQTIASVEVVDPSFFDENTNIIYLVVGKMFAAFKESIDKNNEDTVRIHDLMMAFQNVLSQISMMGKSPLNENDTDIHQLENLLVTVNLKKSLKKLVDCYLKFYGKDFLVIPVDDIDNNTDQAYRMMEQIRKYLILPNVIILISFKLEQISNVVELSFTKLYSPLSARSKNLVNVGDMAQKYLLKLFPLEHRVALPDLKTMMDRELEVYKKRGDKEAYLSGSSMKYTMTALIFRMTRYLFYHATGETSQIVPTNLREYRNLLSLLCNMEAYRESKEEYNKQQFRDYFYGEWVEKHLSEEGRVIAQKLTENTEAGQFNKLVLSSLSGYKPLSEVRLQEFQELQQNEDSEDNADIRPRRLLDIRSQRPQYEYYQIMDPGNLSYNISIGDVFAVLNEWKKYVVAEEDKALLFFVESLYSIKLYHYYDEVTEPTETEISRNAAIDETIKRLDELEGVSNYEQLIGGAFFNPNLLRFLPFEGNTKNRKSRSYRVVNIKPLKDVIGRCGDPENAPSDLEFQLTEFFALTLSRRLEDKAKDSLFHIYRLGTEVYYRSDLQKSLKAIFDLGSFFVSITNIQFAYDRLHPDLYRIALTRPNSLLVKLMALTNEKYGLGLNYENDRFLSWCAIRNAVILQELGNSFSYVKTGRTQSSDQIELLRDFFSQVTGFHIKTYDKTDEKTAYDIRFDYAIVYVQLFNELKADVAGTSLFWQVFDGEEIVEEVATKPFEVHDIAHGLQREVVKDTLARRILERTSITRENADFWDAFNELVVERKIPREQAEIVLRTLKERFSL